MKHTTPFLSALLSCLVFSEIALAQIDININIGKEEWYENPWVWVGGAAFLLLVLLILRRPKK